MGLNNNTMKDPTNTFIGGLVIGGILSALITSALLGTWFLSLI